MERTALPDRKQLVSAADAKRGPGFLLFSALNGGLDVTIARNHWHKPKAPAGQLKSWPGTQHRSFITQVV